MTITKRETSSTLVNSPTYHSAREICHHKSFRLLGHAGLDNEVAFIHSLTFASTAITIVSGAVAERIKLEVYMILSFVIVGLIYAYIVRAAWAGDGWLYNLGFWVRRAM